MIYTDKQIASRLGEMFDFYKSDDVSLEGLIKQINPNSVDLTIAEFFKRPNKIKNPVVYGFTCQAERDIYNAAYWRDDSAENGYILFKPGDVILAYTREYLTMPDDMYGQIFTKSTLGRMFINHMMAGVVDAGFNGRLTLELKNDGEHYIRIPVGARVVQMVCYGLDETPDNPYYSESRNSRYNGAMTVETAKYSGE